MPEVLSDVERTKLLQADDAEFYAQPRFVHHVERPFRDRLTRLYATELADGHRVLDLMSSWVSHLPESFDGEVVGHGLNAEELAANESLDDWVVQDLNADQTLPFEDASFDAVLCAVSVQYLQYPGAVFADLARVLRPGGVCVVSFSNRLFVQKAVRAWRERDMDARADLVCRYVESTGAFDAPEVVREMAGSEPFYAVVARRTRE
ncbi:class I SAM-dependent methyltransferase [Halorarius litoreus]|uniref:class I SAM-dependent methyltransferase n=1 Tax=Halorarius litoreus TaxID=2962676 RepID=UPI0020CFCDAF|nr:class I SAM-dependent methyltransferase [Halorarius litoreus]